MMAESSINYFSLNHTKRLIQELKSFSVNMSQEMFKAKKNKLTGKTVVFTGELKGFSRWQAEELVRQADGAATSTVSSKTDFLVAGENAGSKLDKAMKLGLKIINEKEFSRLIVSE